MGDVTSKTHSVEPIVITMFGEFSIRAGKEIISDSVARTHQLWHLIEYLIAFRHKTITQERLIEALWPDDDIDKPVNALKNLVYRARATLSSHGFTGAKEMIVYRQGGYHWNNDLPCRVDTEEFDRFYTLATKECPSIEKRIEYYRQTIALYQGNFLPNARFEPWVVPLASTYRAQYFHCVYALLDILLAQQAYAEMESICEQATRIDPFEEEAQRYLILSLIRQGKQTQAMAVYNKITDLFFRELGVSPSAATRALYREIVKGTHDVEMDLSIIKEDLKETDDIGGAFYCEYEVFKNMYRLEARTAVRTGQSIFLSLITIEDADGNSLDVKLQNKIMDSLFELIQGNLRKGDVFARFSASQYVLMLPALTFENCSMVMDRITKRFGQLHRSRNMTISAKIQPLDPIGIH